jgi:hypothetical protein
MESANKALATSGDRGMEQDIVIVRCLPGPCFRTEGSKRRTTAMPTVAGRHSNLSAACAVKPVLAANILGGARGTFADPDL